MKKQLLFGAAVLLALSGCNKPKERSATMNKDVVDKVFAISDLAEITAANKKTVIIKTASKKDILAMDDKLVVATTDGKIGDLLKKVKSDASKAALDDQLSTGAIALVVLKDQIKIYKVVKNDPPTSGTILTETQSDQGSNTSTDSATNGTTSAVTDGDAPLADASAAPAAPPTPPDTALHTFNYLSRLKALAKSADVKEQSDIQTQLNAAKAEKPVDVGDKYGFVEITSLPISKVGVLDNERTDYGEKKSTLNVIDSPFQVATHILVDDEVVAKKADDGSEQSSDAAQ